MGTHRRDAASGQMHFTLHRVHLQEPDNNGPENTPEGRGEGLKMDSKGPADPRLFAATPSSSAVLSPLTRSPFLSRSPGEQNKQPGQSPDTFPSNFHCRMCSFSALMACHFSGAFGQELILESKQIFRGAIFHQVLIFLHSQSLYSLI